MTEIARVPFHGSDLHTALGDDGQPVVILRPTLEGMGLDYSAQLKKLKTRSWATVVETATVAEDGSVRTMASVNLDTWAMLLANVDERRVSEVARPLVVAYQRESAQALRDYWTAGGAVNPRASVDQLGALDDAVGRAREQAEVLAILRQGGVVDAAWLEVQGRHLAAVVLGIEPVVEPQVRSLTISDYLAERGLSGSDQRGLSSTFGKRVKALYRQEHDAEPPQVDRLIDGTLRKVAGYTEAHRPLFDQAWLTWLSAA